MLRTFQMPLVCANMYMNDVYGLYWSTKLTAYTQNVFFLISKVEIPLRRYTLSLYSVCVNVSSECSGESDRLRFLGTDVSPFPNFNNSVLTTRRNLLLHC